jgi:non-ribosomal peptide synthase protein (TIGR01720 family)
VHDNFFELGGDSILTIQVIARANQAGLRLSPRQLFQAPTVAKLAAVAGKAPAIHAEQGPVVGTVPLTPIQRWFFEEDFAEPHHWNQAFLLEAREALDVPAFTSALTAVLTHHDALRMRFTPTAEGWHQLNADLMEEVPFEQVDLSAQPPKRRAAALEAGIAAAQASLDLAHGPLMRVVHFDMGPAQPGRLLIVVHHLVIDGVSWRILMEDLVLGYEQRVQGREIDLPDKTTSFKHWAERLSDYARSEEVRDDLAYWSEALRAWDDESAPSLPLDLPGGENLEASAERVVVTLDREETRQLLQDVHGAYGTEINDVLLTALVDAMATATKQRALLIDLEGHGREDLFEDVDVSRTVGWFTTTYPVLLDLRDVRDTGDALKAIKEQLRAVPQKGLGYGLLRYLSPTWEDLKGQGSEPRLSFNYLGQFDQVLAPTEIFGLAPESVGASRSPNAHRSHVLDVNGAVVDGQLQIEWTYSTALHRHETIDRLAEAYLDALRRIISHCLLPDAVGYTPSDFPDVALSEDELDAVIFEIED